jgi:RNA polymerase sigma-70 factor (ECF subfamily)
MSVEHSKPLDGDATEPSAEELARDARAGSEASYATLVGLFQKPLYQYLRFRTQSAADAEELVHESFVRAWRNLERYDERWRFSTWLYTIARREAASFHRRRRINTAPDGMPIAFDPCPEPVMALGDAEVRGALWDLARRLLSVEQFDALWLRYAEDLTPREIAAVFDRDASSVRVLLFRARRSLAAHLQQEPADEISRPTMHEIHNRVRGA